MTPLDLYIVGLLQDNIDYHVTAIKRTKDFITTPDDKAWVASHEKQLAVAQSKSDEFKARFK